MGSNLPRDVRLKIELIAALLLPMPLCWPFVGQKEVSRQRTISDADTMLIAAVQGGHAFDNVLKA